MKDDIQDKRKKIDKTYLKQKHISTSTIIAIISK